jgi:hypothetical protein
MTPERAATFDARTEQAIGELQRTIARRYPSTSFEVTRSSDDSASIHLIAVVDVDDPDEVGDLVVDRVVDLQVEDRIPIHVIPVRTPERVAAELAERRQVGPRARRSVPLFGRPPLSTR